MSGEVQVIKTIEELQRFLNENGVMEIVTRGKGKKFKEFFKVSLENIKESDVSEKLKEMSKQLAKNNDLNLKSLTQLGNIAKLNKVQLIMSGVNLCATCVGFAVMNSKLEKIIPQLMEVVSLFKKSQGITTDFEFKKVIESHSDMLDCRKKQSYYSEEKMRELVSSEYTVLDLLMNVFSADVSDNKEALLISILTLASMLSVSIKYFDELYYFNNKEAIGDGDVWHLSHSTWTSVFDRLNSEEFVEKVQDCGVFDIDLNLRETDCFCKNYLEQVSELKRDIEDNQQLILAVDDLEMLKAITAYTNDEVRGEIEHSLEEVGISIDVCADALRMATA